MTWTYNPAQLQDATVGPLMQVRLLIGDTNTAEQEMQDEEITFFLSEGGSIRLVAAACADGLAAKYAREVDLSTTAGATSLKASQATASYAALSKRLRNQALRRVIPWAGGISAADKLTQQEDQDRVPPAFWVGMEQNPGTPNPTDQPIT